MSKPYFAKYLPVEGEVKPADASIDNEGNIVENTIKEWLAMRNLINLRKVKLFLCSRDIQVGDKFFHPHDFTNAFIAREDTIDWHSAIGTFKVIGEISPEATWVKEGDEFDENDVHRNHICYDSPGNTGCCLHCSRSMGCDSQDYNYMIKGPCGHFH